MAQNVLHDSPTSLYRPKLPLQTGRKDFINNKYAAYAWLREHEPVTRGKLSFIPFWLVSRYDDCLAVTNDARFVRDKSKVTGGSRFPVPLPKSLQAIAGSMIYEDEPEHRRHRSLVTKAFTPHAIERLSEPVEELSHRLLDAAEKEGTVDLVRTYAMPIPLRVISDMVGVDGPHLQGSIKMLSEGFTGWRILRSILYDLPAATRYMRSVVRAKRSAPGDDILTKLIEAEEEGEHLSEDELVSMIFLLIMAGYETTTHLITNCVVTLLDHPDQLGRLRDEPALLDSAVEEVLRFNPPIHGTKPNTASEDIEIGGVTISKGEQIIPLLASANRDPRAFDEPDVFDIGRTPNHHLAFSHGAHFCLGAQLARMETRTALKNLIARNPNLRLAVPRDELKLTTLPLWHRYVSVPIRLG